MIGFASHRWHTVVMVAAVVLHCRSLALAQSVTPAAATIESKYEGSNRASDPPFEAVIRLKYGTGWVRVEAYEFVGGTGEVLRDIVQDDGKQSVGFDMTRRAGWRRTSSLSADVAGVGLESFCAPTAWYRLIERAKQSGVVPRTNSGESIWEFGGVRVATDNVTGRVSSAGWWAGDGTPKRVFFYDDWGDIGGLVLPRAVRMQEPDRFSAQPRVYERTYRVTKASAISDPATPPAFSFPPSVLVTDASTGIVSDSQGKPVGHVNQSASTGWSPSQQQLTLVAGCAGLGFFVLAAYVYWKRRA